jgi:hypothetical protein
VHTHAHSLSLVLPPLLPFPLLLLRVCVRSLSLVLLLLPPPPLLLSLPPPLLLLLS